MERTPHAYQSGFVSRYGFSHIATASTQTGFSHWAFPALEIHASMKAGKGARRELFLRPLVDPVIHCLVPKLCILRLLNPVAFVGEIEHLRRDIHPLQCGEQLKTF